MAFEYGRKNWENRDEVSDEESLAEKVWRLHQDANGKANGKHKDMRMERTIEEISVLQHGKKKKREGIEIEKGKEVDLFKVRYF